MWIPGNSRSGYQEIQGVDTRKFNDQIPRNSKSQDQKKIKDTWKFMEWRPGILRSGYQDNSRSGYKEFQEVDTEKFNEWIPGNLRSGYKEIQEVDTEKFKKWIPRY